MSLFCEEKSALPVDLGDSADKSFFFFFPQLPDNQFGIRFVTTFTVSRNSLQPLSDVVDLDRKYRAKREVSY